MITTMKALRFSESNGLRVENVPIPEVRKTGQTFLPEARIRVIRAGICSTDIHIINGYVPGFEHTLGHEFVGVVDDVTDPEQHSYLIGCRVVGEINCKCDQCTHPDPIFVRNHAPVRTVLGIIGKDGCMAEYCTLPVENLHVVPDDVSDAEACFAEPLAAACRIAEQQVVKPGDRIAVIGDGKLGILCAHVLAQQKELQQPPAQLTFIGRHQRKLDLVQGNNIERIVLSESSTSHQIDTLRNAFDVVVEASGSPQGITLALALTRPLGILVQKSTCSTVVKDPSNMPMWSEVANDVVVNEKRLIGSRCGPFPPALRLLKTAETKRLVASMIDATLPLERGVEAIEIAQRKGALKVQLLCGTLT